MSVKTVFFKNDEIYKKAKVGFFIQAIFKECGEVEVWIDDLSKESWSKPLEWCYNLSTGEYKELKQPNNPKVRKYKSLTEFDEHFYIPNQC